MMTLSIRDALFEHEMFDVLNRTTFYGTPNIRYLESLWDFSEDEVNSELKSLHKDNLIARTDSGHWHATDQGKYARERRLQERGKRHQSLVEQSGNLSVLLIALIASEHHDDMSLSLDYFIEDAIPFYLWKHSIENINGVLQMLVDNGDVKKFNHLFRSSRKCLKLTPNGRIKFVRNIAPDLGLHSSVTILMSPKSVPAFNRLKLYPEYAKIVQYRWEEADKCVKAQCWLSASIMYGSILEIILQSILETDKRSALQTKNAPKRGKERAPVTDISQWTLENLIEVASELNKIDRGIANYGHALRDTRNLVHPGKQLKDGTEPDSKLVDICRSVVEAVVERLTLEH